MKLVKKILIGLVLVLAVASALAVITGNKHIFKAVSSTYLVGKTGPSIDDYTFFTNRVVLADKHQPWKVNKQRYNQIKNDSFHNKIESYEPASFLIAQNNEIIYEEYWDEYSENSLTNSFSMAKSFVSLLVGIALDEGKINSLDDPIGMYLEQYKNNPELKIKHLLTMSSGIDFDESYSSPFGHMAKAYYGTDIKKLNTKYSPTNPPGEEFIYLGGNTIILGFLVEKVTGMTISEYFSRKIWRRIGAKNNALWTLDKESGTEKAYCCFYSNARDYAKIGQLILNKGLWGNDRIISKQYLDEAIKPAYYLKTKDGNPVDFYGYQIWNTYYKNMDITFCRGILGQYIIVIPEKNMVIVRLGHKRSKEFINGNPADLYDYIDFALTKN